MSTLALPRRWSGEAAGSNPLAGLARSIASRARRSMQAWQDRRRLQTLPDYLLDDIGVSRIELGPAAEFDRIRRLGPSYRI